MLVAPRPPVKKGLEMLNRCLTRWLIASVPLWMCVIVATARGDDLVGPPAEVPAVINSADSLKVEKPRVTKSEALPLGKAKESQALSKPAEDSTGKLMDPGTATTVGALATVLSVIGVIAYFARNAARKSGGLWAAMGAGGRAPSGILEVLGRYPVGRGCTLVLLKLDRRILLVSQSSGGKLGGVTMTTLCEVDEAEDVASILLKSQDAETEQSRQKFEHMLTQEDRAYSKRGEIPIEPVPMPLRSVKRATVGTVPANVHAGMAKSEGMSPLQARLENLRGRARFEVRG